MRTVGAAWAALLTGAAMVAAPLAPVPPDPVDVGVVPAVAPVLRRVDPPPVDLLRGVRAAPPVPAPVLSPPRPSGSPPERLRVAALGVDAAVVAVDVNGGALAVPDDPAVVGWWRGGSAPGSGTGPVVLAGHVDTRAAGPGALFHLAALRPADRVVLGTGGGEAAYVVTGVRHYPKGQLPAEAFAAGGAPRLVMVTCGGAFDRRTRHYADNVVAYAVPVPDGS